MPHVSKSPTGLCSRTWIYRPTMRAREQKEANVEKVLEALLADADQVAITEKDGVREISARFDLRKAPPKESSS